MGGRGASSGAGRGKSKVGASGGNNGIARLQDVTRNSRTSDLVYAFDMLNPKPISQMTNEEKMVRAVVIDELSQRGNIIYDPKQNKYTKYNKPEQVVNTEDRSYRVDKVEKRSVYTGNNNYQEKEFADCEYFYNGKWIKVKNPKTERNVADLFKEKKKKK